MNRNSFFPRPAMGLSVSTAPQIVIAFPVKWEQGSGRIRRRARVRPNLKLRGLSIHLRNRLLQPLRPRAVAGLANLPNRSPNRADQQRANDADDKDDKDQRQN